MAFMTLALTQVFGMTGDDEVKKVLKKAVDLIVKTQNYEGGWRYEPLPTGADISVPSFIEQGESIKVDTRTGEYVERVTVR